MKKFSKRFAAIVLCAVLLIGVMPVTSSAADDAVALSFVFTKEKDTTSELDYAKINDIIYVGIKADNLPSISGFVFSIHYDAQVLDLQEEYSYSIEIPGIGSVPVFTDGLYQSGSFARPTPDYVVDEVTHIGTASYAWASSSTSGTANNENGVMFYIPFKVIGTGLTNLEFNTEHDNWQITIPGDQRAETIVSNGSLLSVTTGVNLTTTDVTVDGSNGATISAMAFGNDVEEITSGVVWEVSGEENSGVSINENGTITIDAKAKAGEYTVTATATGGDGTFGESNTASATFTVNRASSVAESLSITPETASEITIPADGEQAASTAFTATVTDQFDDTMSADIQWSVSAEDGTVLSGITIENGTLKVGNEAKSIITDTTGKALTVTAKYGTLTDATTVTVKRAASVATSVDIYKDGGESAIESDTIAIPQSGSTNVTYTAKVLDQYGGEITGASVMWSNDNSLSGVTVSNNTVTVAKDATAGNFTLKAESGSFNTSLVVNIVTIAFEGQDTAVSTVDSPIYGMTWGEIIKVNDSAISAKVGETQVEGTYSVENADTIPDAGNSVEYRVIFTSNDGNYVGVEVARDTVEIAQKPVTVSGITANDKVYDGTTVAKLNTDSASIGGKVDNDDVTIDVANATGTFDTENVGTGKTVTISGIALGGNDAGNYKLSSDSATTTADITAKELTADVSSVSVAKEYDGTTAAGTVSGAATAETGISGETVTVNVSAGEYADKNVSTGKSVTLTLSLGGDNAGNYTLSNKTAAIETASITPSSSITDATATEQNVVVGVGTFTAPKFTGVTVNGVAETVEGTVTYTIDGTSNMTYEQAKAALAQKDKGRQIEVGYSFTSTDTNYVTTAQTGTITVTMVDIAFEIREGGITVDNAPVYGATWSDIVKVDGSRITAKVGEDTVTGTYTVKDASVRPGAGSENWEVLFTGTLGDKTYTDVTVQTGTVTVKQKELTITGLSAADKPYDGNTTATVSGTAVLNGVLAGDTVNVTTGTAAFDSKNAGTQTVTFSGYGIEGASASNYVLSAQPASVTATISPKPVTITGVTAEDKTYDGNTTAIPNVSGASISGIIVGDAVTIQSGTGTFASADVGENIEVTFSGFALTGEGSGNYTLSAQPASTTANITQANATGTPNSVTDNVLIKQDAAQTGSVSIDQFFQTIPAGAVITSVAPASGSVMDSVAVEDGVIKYSSKANLETENVTDTYTVTIATQNYNNITATLTFTTVAKTPVNISGVSVTGAGKTYDGKAVSYTGTPAAKTNDGTTVAVTGTYSYVWQKADGTVLASAPKDAGIYKLVITLDDPAYIGSAEVSFTIAKAKITITAEDAEAYTGSDMPKLSYTVTGLATGEKLAKEPSISCAADMKKAGSYVIAVSGAEVPNTNNYEETITYVSGTLEVKNRPVNIGPTYDIKVLDSENGSVKASLGNASEGSVITLTVTPDEGYRLGSITVIDENGDDVEVRRSGSEYKFTMPDSDVRVSARFVRDTGALPFNDVNAGDWFYEYVAYVYNNGIMDGVDSGVFSPNTATTRGMVVTVLYRLYGEPAVRGDSSFTDVAPGAYYADAVAWASNAGIVNGTSGTTFSPNDLVTREQFAAMLYRYMQYTGADTSARASLSGFADAGKVSPYAADAVAWAVTEGILNGRSATEIAPQGNCTRAEVAAMITRVFG